MVKYAYYHGGKARGYTRSVHTTHFNINFGVAFNTQYIQYLPHEDLE
jgi:hypothetical protein